MGRLNLQRFLFIPWAGPAIAHIAMAKPKIPMMAYAKLTLNTMLVTYPFALVVLELPKIDAFAFQSCSRRACTFIQILGTGVAPPFENYATKGLAKAYHVIVNGKDDEFFLHPACPGYSQEQMRDTCESMHVKKTVLNPLEDSWLKYPYACAIVAWALFSMLHDFCLMRGMKEFLTLRLGFASAFSLMLAVIVGFFWSMGVLEVFAAEVIPEVCACYYVLPELRAIVAILTPCLLYLQSIKKLQQLSRAILVGDHLYFQSYDVPFALAKQTPAAIDAGSFVVSTAHGFHQAEVEERLMLSEIRWLCLFQRLLMATFMLPLSFSMAIATGPAAVRILQYASTEQLPQHFEIMLILGLVAFPWYMLLNMWSLSPCKFKGGLHLETWERRRHYFNFFLRFVIFTVVIIGLGWATGVLCYELLVEETPISSDHALLVSEAGVAYFVLGLQVYVWVVELQPTHQAVLMKARKLYPPSMYIMVATSHPEYNLAVECQLAEEFLQDFPGSKLNEELNWQVWQSRLQGESFSDLESSSDERCPQL